MRLLIRWIVNAIALFVVASLVPGIEASSIMTLFIAALVLGLLNAVVRPVLLVLTLPITVVTLGLFIFVLNALVFWLAAAFVPGFTVDGFIPALLGALVFSIISMLTSWIGKEKDD
jgi:putative membrane protein